LFFTILKTTEQHIVGIFETQNSMHTTIKIYTQLLHVARLAMTIGLKSDETIDSLIELQLLTTKHNDMETEISNIVEDAIRHLQTSIFIQSYKHMRM